MMRTASPQGRAASGVAAEALSQALPLGPAVPAAPGDYPRRLLLAVVGQSPQVLTETVYALAVEAAGGDAFVPTEIEVITTEAGACRVRERLLAAVDGVWQQLLIDYGIGPVQFDGSSIHVVHDCRGEPLHDIRSAADNACMADAITERVRLLTADPDCALHVSLAGGRKTMGYYAGYALSLFGRAQDRLSHVLVAAGLEDSPGFYYPRPGSHAVDPSDGAAMSGPGCRAVELAQIPFVRLRSLLPAAMLARRSSFADVVASARTPAPRPQLRLDVAARTAVADGVTIAMTPTQFALLAVLAQRARSGSPALQAPLRDTHDAQWAAEVLADLRAAVGVMEVDSAVAASLMRDCSGSKISPHLSRLRRLLRAHLAAGRVALYFDEGQSHRHKRYRVPLAADDIEIVRPAVRRKLAERGAGVAEQDTQSGAL